MGTLFELQRLRQPDAETGLRVPTTHRGELASSPFRDSVPNFRNRPAKAMNRLPGVGRLMAILVTGIVVAQTLLAIDHGGVNGVLSLIGVLLIIVYSILVAVNFSYSIYQGLKESRNS